MISIAFYCYYRPRLFLSLFCLKKNPERTGFFGRTTIDARWSIEWSRLFSRKKLKEPVSLDAPPSTPDDPLSGLDYFREKN
jgi:hypothetical protein